MSLRWPTDEQWAILDEFSSGRHCVVEACAGAGKTSTLRMCASQTSRRGIYAAFNRSIAQEAQRTFSDNVQSSTVHSIAWRAYGNQFDYRMPSSDRPRQGGMERKAILGVTETLTLSSGTYLSSARIASLAIDTVKRFCYSADDEVSYSHVPFIKGAEDDMSVLREIVWPIARRAWDDICDDHGKLVYTHDYYLKRYCMTRPQLGCDFLLIDEAQDANPVITDLALHQDCQRVLIGDSNQAIYEWRLAEDSLRNAEGTRLPLTKSFRFGPAIADVANEILGELGSDTQVVGCDRDSTVGRIDEPSVILCRTNAVVVEHALASQKRGKTVAVVGGADSILKLAEASKSLKAGKGTSHPDLFGFRTWEQVQAYVHEEKEDAGEIATFVRIIDEYGPDLVIGVASATVPEQSADVIVSTTHKAKGLEWSHVTLADDFLARDVAEELRLAYVAVTRAQDRLDDRGLKEARRKLAERQEKREKRDQVASSRRT